MKAELIDVFGNDLLVANTARVSMGKWHTEFDAESDTRLIKYLARENHFSPFCHPKAMFRLELPLFVARQWEKHRIGVVRGYDIYDQNEVSRRYVDDEPGFFDPVYWRERPKGNIKQGSGDFLPEYLQVECGYVLEYTHAQALLAYQRLLTLGVAPEQARMVLPQNTMTNWIWSGSLMAFARVCNLRLDPHAQAETREVAVEIDSRMNALFPVSWNALTK